LGGQSHKDYWRVTLTHAHPFRESSVKMLNIYLISEFGNLLKDIPLAFTNQDVKIFTVGGSRSLFKKHENFVEVPSITSNSFIQSLLLEEKLIDFMDGLVLIGSDPEMREIVEANVNLDIKLKLLPIKNPEAFKILDSKVGLQQLTAALQLSAPKGLVIEKYADLSHIEDRINLQYFFKGDKGGGGANVSRMSVNSPVPNIQDLTFPLLLQEEIVGTEVHIDAYFANGILRAYIYTDQIKSMSKYGPAYERRIARPPIEDFLDPLEATGKFTKAHGMVNTTFIFDCKLNKHFLIEFDPRPNAWHFLAPSLGIDLVSIFSGLATEKIATPNRVDFRIVNLDRFIYHLSDRKNPLVFAKELATIFDSNLLVIRGHKLNGLGIFKILVVRLLRILAFKLTRKLFRILPGKITNPLKRRNITNKIAYRILGTF
jgi:hypothetical protein